MKNLQTILALSGVLLALGLLATWDEWQLKKDQEQEKNKNRIAQFSEIEIQSLVYESKPFDNGSEEADSDSSTLSKQPVSFILERVENNWKIIKPVSADADQNAVSTMISSILEYAYTDIVGEGEENYEKFGLKDPSRMITFNLKAASSSGVQGPAPWKIMIGNKVPVGYNVYFRTSDSDKIYSGSQHLLLSTAKSLFEIRDKSVADIISDKVNTFRFLKGGEIAVEIQKKDGSFQFSVPQTWELDPQDFREYVNLISDTKAISFADSLAADLESLSKQPDFEVIWTTEGGAHETLKFAARDGKFWVFKDHNIMEIAEGDFKKLNKKVEDFRSKRVFGIKPLEIVRVDIDGARFERKGGLWYREEDASKVDIDDKQKNGTQVDKIKDVEHISAFVVDLELLKTEQIYPYTDSQIAAFVSKEPLHIIKMDIKDQQITQKVSLYEFSDKDSFLLTHSSSELVYRVKKSHFSNMTESSSKAGLPENAVHEGSMVPQDLESLEGLNSEDLKDITMKNQEENSKL